MAIARPHNVIGNLFVALGFAGLATGMGTLAYQGSFWWFDGDWNPLSVHAVLGDFGNSISLLQWPGAQEAIYWISNQPLATVLLGAGVFCYVIGRGVG
ncbi:MAG: hypothetical protein KGI51_14435 [Rhodospirillales bacterium]|nr:hypothetical protein [Rhodospirillales bacterium]